MLQHLKFLFRNINLEQLAGDPVLAKDVERASLKCSQTIFEEKTEPSLLVSRNVGNMYTPSLYSALASVLVRLVLSSIFPQFRSQNDYFL